MRAVRLCLSIASFLRCSRITSCTQSVAWLDSLDSSFSNSEILCVIAKRVGRASSFFFSARGFSLAPLALWYTLSRIALDRIGSFHSLLLPLLLVRSGRRPLFPRAAAAVARSAVHTAMLHPPPPASYPPPPPGGHGLTHGRRSHHASTASLGSTGMGGLGVLSPSGSNASLMLGGGATQRVYPFPPPPLPNAALNGVASSPAALAAASVAAGAPFPFLRLKSFSPHTHAVLKRLENAVTQAPANPQPYLDLAEEYRVLGARGAFLRLLEYGHARFPAEVQFKTLLYSHAPNRARTPPPPEPAIAMTRTVTYDYRWRHREENLFPKQIRKLDTNVPPYGRQVRAMHLAALAILSAEDTFLSPAARAKQRAAALEAMERGERDGSDAEHAVAIVIPAGFNKIRGAQGVLPFAATPPPPPPPARNAAGGTSDDPVSPPSFPAVSAAAAHPTTPSTGSSSGRKLLSPSKDQVRRDSMSNLSAVASTLRREAASASPPPAASSAPHTPQTPEEAQESLERQWAAEDAQREKEEQEHAQARAKELAEVQVIKEQQARAKERAATAAAASASSAVPPSTGVPASS